MEAGVESGSQLQLRMHTDGFVQLRQPGLPETPSAVWLWVIWFSVELRRGDEHDIASDYAAICPYDVGSCKVLRRSYHDVAGMTALHLVHSVVQYLIHLQGL